MSHSHGEDLSVRSERKGKGEGDLQKNGLRSLFRMLQFSLESRRGELRNLRLQRMFLGMPRGKLRARETTQIVGKRLLKAQTTAQTKVPVRKVTRTILTSSCGTSNIQRENAHLLTSSRLAAKKRKESELTTV